MSVNGTAGGSSSQGSINRAPRHRSSDLETPDLELTLFLFVSQSREGGTGRSRSKALDLASVFHML